MFRKILKDIGTQSLYITELKKVEGKSVWLVLSYFCRKNKIIHGPKKDLI